MNKNIDAILACRVQGARLYGKPLQNLIPGGITIIESLIEYLREIKSLRKIVLAISEGNENYGFIRLAEKLSLPYVIGDEYDVLQRILDAAKQEGSERVFRITTEGPFVLYEYADALIQEFVEEGYDWASYMDVPEGTGYELISTNALRVSHARGATRHRSELVTSYICEHQDEFKLLFKELPEGLRRPEVRLTVDYPEDLVFCQAVYRSLKKEGRLIPVEEIIEFWDHNPVLRKPLENIGLDWGTGRLVWSSSDEERMSQKAKEDA